MGLSFNGFELVYNIKMTTDRIEFKGNLFFSFAFYRMLFMLFIVFSITYSFTIIGELNSQFVLLIFFIPFSIWFIIEQTNDLHYFVFRGNYLYITNHLIFLKERKILLSDISNVNGYKGGKNRSCGVKIFLKNQNSVLKIGASPLNIVKWEDFFEKLKRENIAFEIDKSFWIIFFESKTEKS